MTSDIANGAVIKEKLNPNAVKLVVLQREMLFALTPYSQPWGIIQCNADDVLTGGGFATGGGKDVHPTISAKNANGWAAALVNTGAHPH
ncbi:MAG: hypothetical protein E6L04_09525 [Thaumarchaeota archaeon]|nr:MAG: hypothetical protein E6L04_09525 [Nitrososphaerota archaeon]TLX86622.1 MAG: hypothetical protein E6K97_10975 [Nitrososphaerota archaeon]